MKRKELRVERFLDEMNRVVPWRQLTEAIRPYYKETGGAAQKSALKRAKEKEPETFGFARQSGAPVPRHQASVGALQSALPGSGEKRPDTAAKSQPMLKKHPNVGVRPIKGFFCRGFYSRLN